MTEVSREVKESGSREEATSTSGALDSSTRPLGWLYLVATPRPKQPEAEFLLRVQDALDGGVDTLQLRCKDWEARPYIALAEKVRDLAHAKNVPFFVNDRTGWTATSRL